VIKVIVNLTYPLFVPPMCVVIIGGAGIQGIGYPAVERNPLQQVRGVGFDLSDIVMPFFQNGG